MDKIEIIGGNPIEGKVNISGSKNAALPILAACLLTEKTVELQNIPNLSDIHSMTDLLRSLNSEIIQGNYLRINCKVPKYKVASYDLVRKMRASFLVLGPLLTRYGNAKVSLPGGCAIGARPIDTHLFGLEKMGVKFEFNNGYVIGESKDGLKGSKINLPIVSVGATENLIMAATLAEGETHISNAAIEPEVSDLCFFLNELGADIKGIGTNYLIIKGKSKLNGGRYKVMSDRIEAGTFALAVLGCGGSIEMYGINEEIKNHFLKIFSKLKQLNFKYSEKEENLIVKNLGGSYPSVNISTAVYPGFPTDLQAQLIAVMTKADGISKIKETIFENRFMHVQELARMGANISLNGSVANIVGQKQINGAEVMATDLRASSSLVIAGLMAKGKTTINRVYHLDRGYENLECKLAKCNLSIERK